MTSRASPSRRLVPLERIVPLRVRDATLDHPALDHPALDDAALDRPALDDAALDDAVLVARARAGDRWAEAAIYRRHAPAIGRLALRLLGRREDALDVLQDVFVQALEQLEDLRDPGALGGWLKRMTVHRAHRRFRRRRLARMLGLDRGEDATLDALASADAGPEARAELARVAVALRSMSARRRIAWTLHRVEGETLPAIAEALACSLATVKREIAEADAAVRATLRAEEDER